MWVFFPEIRMTVRSFQTYFRLVVYVRTKKDKYQMVGEVFKYKPVSAATSRLVDHFSSETPNKVDKHDEPGCR